MRTPRIPLVPSDLPTGTVIRKQYRGVEHVVEVVAPIPFKRGAPWRFLYKGQRYRSLSAISVLITGAPGRGGPIFFGLHDQRRKL